MKRRHDPNEGNAPMPETIAFIEAQREAAENAARVVNAACDYALSWNRAWLDLWDNQFEDYFDLPRKFTDFQTELMARAIDRRQDGMRRVSYTLARSVRGHE